MTSSLLDTPQAAGAALDGCTMVDMEFIYRPRPLEQRRRALFDVALHLRLTELARQERAGVCFLCADEASAASLEPLLKVFASLRKVHIVVNPPIMSGADGSADRQTPALAGWENPTTWIQYAVSDRWARIRFALETTSVLAGAGYVVLAAHDALWGSGLLEDLISFSKGRSAGGLPAAVSPYSPWHHSSVPGAALPQWGIDSINAAFGRDFWMRLRLTRGSHQGFWGKTGLIPFQMSAEILRRVDLRVWEDDLEIDRAVREAGFASCALWIDDPLLYRQSLPIYNQEDLRQVIDRTIHYSLNIPASPPGATSLILRELALPLRMRRRLDRRYAAALALVERTAEECVSAARSRIERYGMSWVDWGSYRYVVRVGDPFVQVWFHNERV
ncbi:MAG: hypothetical protein JNL42_18525 [Anaerolineae bacterium]|nr:hypothetical protein [Anaerolineae bacterium]